MTPLDVIRRYLGTARGGDPDGMVAFYAPDVVAHIPGRGPFAGDLHGPDALFEYISAARALSRNAEVELDVVDVLASDERVALLVRERFHTGDGVVDIRRANVYRVRNERIVEVSIYEADQYAVDALLGGTD